MQTKKDHWPLVHLESGKELIQINHQQGGNKFALKRCKSIVLHVNPFYLIIKSSWMTTWSHLCLVLYRSLMSFALFKFHLSWSIEEIMIEECMNY